MTTIAIVCPGCGARLRTNPLPDREKAVRCPRCASRSLVAPASGQLLAAQAPRRRPSVRTVTLAATLVLGGAASLSAWHQLRANSRNETQPTPTRPAPPVAVAAVTAPKPPEPKRTFPTKIDPDSLPARLVRRALNSLESLAKGPPPPDRSQLARGQELFTREWLADDPRSHGGDGLGPVFNDSSCVACHNLGGPGGGGPSGKNVDILTAATTRPPNAIAAAQAACAPTRPLDESIAEGDLARVSAPELKAARGELEELAKVHVGFRHTSSVVLHRFSTDPDYEPWRFEALGGQSPQGADMGPQSGRRTVKRRPRSESLDQLARMEIQHLRQQAAAMPSRAGAVQLPSRRSSGSTVLRSQRNTTALFGAGLIDTIPDHVLRAAASWQDRDFPEVQGRVAQKRDGSIGRFGWKAQTARLEDFVLTACAVEVGLEVPGHHQGSLPHEPDYEAPGFDMDQEECDALVAYVRSLPRPAESASSSSDEARIITAGRLVFESVGCASCHRPDLGPVRSIYSDLLLHDMGPELGDVGQYGVFAPEPEPPSKSTPKGRKDSERPRGPSRQEWRTPPLWGLRDSGPYLHDGRAETIEQAIALHGGQGERSALRYFSRTSKERQQLHAFLRSLAAPIAPEPARVAVRVP